MKIGIIGCGLMGRARATAITKSGCATLVSVCDSRFETAEALAAEFGCKAVSGVDELLADSSIDSVVVSVPHSVSHRMTAAALAAGKHVLCEKPVGLTSAECQDLISRRREGQVLAAGFNYRFYPGVRLMRSMIRDGKVGALTHIRVVLGHGGRPGMEAEWKTSKAACGGGALLDPGIHMLDLVRYMAGEFEEVSGSLLRGFWPIDVEDNAFINLRTADGIHAQLHISTTEWKSRMSIDAFGTDGCIRLTGRSGFYGPQVVRWNRRWEWREPQAQEIVTEFAPGDTSFEAEMQAFAELVKGGKSDELGRAEDCFRLLEVIEEVYATNPVHANAAAAAAVV